MDGENIIMVDSSRFSCLMRRRNVVAIVAAGYAHSLALKGNGSVIGWGDNSSGQISIPSNAIGVTAISAGAGS